LPEGTALPSSTRVRGLQWLLGPRALDQESVATALRSADPVLRKYAAVAARRISGSKKEPLLYAATLDDPDIKKFADAGIKLV